MLRAPARRGAARASRECDLTRRRGDAEGRGRSGSISLSASPRLRVRSPRKATLPSSCRRVAGVAEASLHLALETPGSFVVVIGTNGSGKSTALNAVAGAFRVDAGTIRLAGREVTGWPEHRRARLIGRVFQD